MALKNTCLPSPPTQNPITYPEISRSPTRSNKTMSKRKECDRTDVFKKAAKSLLKEGYLVIRVHTLDDTSNVMGAIRNDITTFKDVTPGNTKPLVLGAFGALANAASFHCPSVRSIRTDAYIACRPIFAALARAIHARTGQVYKLEQVIDRLRVSRKGGSKETWHRDLSPSDSGTDLIYGGWYNPSNDPQYFSCVPGSHDDDVPLNRKGFSAEKKSDLVETETMCGGVKTRLVNGRPVERVLVPQGCMIIFSERILHEVVPQKLPCTVRLHTAWRLTTSDAPLFKDIVDRLKHQDVIMVKSGQAPSTYAKLHTVNHTHKLAELDGVYVFPYHTYQPKTGKLVDQCKLDGLPPPTFSVPHVLGETLPSLDAIGKKYDEYTPEEVLMYTPHPILCKSKSKKQKV